MISLSVSGWLYIYYVSVSRVTTYNLQSSVNYAKGCTIPSLIHALIQDPSLAHDRSQDHGQDQDRDQDHRGIEEGGEIVDVTDTRPAPRMNRKASSD